MNTEEIINQLNEVQKLMNLEKYKEAIVLLDKLKELDNTNNFNYNISHRLYQLDSNSRSLYNQQVILKSINNLSVKDDSINFQELNQLLKLNYNLNLDPKILRREIELLILGCQLPWKINKDTIILKPS